MDKTLPNTPRSRHKSPENVRSTAHGLDPRLPGLPPAVWSAPGGPTSGEPAPGSGGGGLHVRLAGGGGGGGGDSAADGGDSSAAYSVPSGGRRHVSYTA